MKTVVYSCPYVPAEWIAAHGLRPSRVLPRSDRGHSAVGARMGLCCYAQAFAAEVCSDAGADAIIVSTLCDQMRRVAELIARECDRPLFVMNLPSTWQTAGAQRLYLDEVRRLGRFLVRLGGTAPSNGELAEVLVRYDDARASIRDARGRLSGRQFAEALAGFHRTGNVSLDGRGPEASARGVPVALLGGPLLRDHFGLYDLIEAAGGQVALDATDSGERALPAPFDRRRLRDDPLLELADAYFGTIPHAFRRPNGELYRWLQRELDARGVRAIILRRYLWCDIWHAEVQRLKEWTDRPVLDLDVSSEDDAEGRAANRIEAFLEALR